MSDNLIEGTKNVVLVHGGFVDGAGWEGVYNILKKDGYNVALFKTRRSRSRAMSPSPSRLLMLRTARLFW